MEALALERLQATADDEEQWSFLFRTEGSIALMYCARPIIEEWEFDGTVDGLDLPWSKERRALIANGDAEPNEQELDQWRRAVCRDLADASDWSSVAHIVPLWVDNTIAGYALFVDSYDDDEAPLLRGIFDSVENAKTALAAEGALADDSQ